MNYLKHIKLPLWHLFVRTEEKYKVVRILNKKLKNFEKKTKIDDKKLQ